MGESKWSLVQFMDGKRRVKYVCLSKDIKGFEPKSADDIPDREYHVKWEKSFHDEDSGISHDGTYPAKILLFGATPEELRIKAKSLKIIVPDSAFPLPASNIPAPVPLKEPLRKARRKAGEEDKETVAKKSRMRNTLAILQSSESTWTPSLEEGVKTSTSSNPDESLAKSSDRKPTSSTVSSASDQEPLENRGTALSVTASPNKSLAKSSDRKPTSSTVSSASDQQPLENSGNELSVAASPKKPQPRKSKSSIVYCRSSDESDFGGDDEDDEDDATIQLAVLKKEHQRCEIKIEQLSSDIQKCKADLKVYRVNMEKKRETISSLKSDIEELKDMNLSLQRQVLHLQSASSKRDKPDETFDKQSSQLSYQSSPKPGSPSRSSSKRDKPDVTFDKQSSSLSYKSSPKPASPAQSPCTQHSPIIKSPDNSKWVIGSIDVKKPAGLNTKPSSVARQLFEEKKDNTSPDTQSISEDDEHSERVDIEDNLEGVSKRIYEDLKGIKPLSGDKLRVHIGMGTYITKEFWEKTIRKQKRDSTFFKDCAQALWGIAGLKVRVADRETAKKKAATPQKVKILHAMLKGRLRVRGLSEEEQDKIIENNAVLWLGQKMYDAGRPPKGSSK